MAQPTSLIISQDTIGTGLQGRAFKGGSSADAGGGKANKVRIINNDPQSGNTDVKLLWVPHDSSGTKLDTDGEATLVQVGPHEWTFEPTAGAAIWGKWRIRAREVVGGADVDEIRIFGIASPVAGLFGPAFNEDADPTGSLLTGAASIADAEDNEGGTIDGWLKDIRKTAEVLENVGGHVDPDAIHDNVAAEISPLSLVTVDGADHILIEDDSDSDNKKRITASQLLSGAGIQRGLTWNFDGASQADSDPGTGKFRADNVTPSAASELFIDPFAVGTVSHNALLLAQKQPGFLYLEQQDDPTRWALFDITALTVVGGGYLKLQVTINGIAASAEIQDGKDISFAFLVSPHPELHTVESHSDTDATGAELDELTDGSTTALHDHAAPSIAHAATTGQTANDHHNEAHTIASHSDTSATGAQLDTLVGGGETALHSHAPNVVQTGTPVDNFITGATGADNGAGPGGSGDDGGILGGDGGDGTTGGGGGGRADNTGGDGGDATSSGTAGVGGIVGSFGGKGGANTGASGAGGGGGVVESGGGAGGTSDNGAGGIGGEVTEFGGDGADSQGGTSSAGAGGSVQYRGGGGGSGSGANAGGAGASYSIDGGSGGSSGSSSDGGAGGTGGTKGGNGGNVSSGTGTGGAGAPANTTGGVGGASSTTAGSNPGTGGNALVAGGDGGASLGGAGTDGAIGGDLSLEGGPGGASGDATAGLDGRVRIGAFNTRAIDSGNVTDKPKFTHLGGTRTPVNDIGAINAADVTADLDDSDHFETSITGACTLEFDNVSDGQTGKIEVTHDAAGATLAKGTNVTYPSGSLVLSAGMGDVDVLCYLVVGVNIRVWVEALDFS